MKCVKCNLENREEAQYCLECGERLLLQCTYCNISLPLSAKFCDKCGKRIDALKKNTEEVESTQDAVQRIVRSNITLKEARKLLELGLIKYTLSKHQGNVKRAAEDLCISRPTLYDLIHKYKLPIDDDQRTIV